MKKHGPSCNSNPCWKCHAEFMRSIEPLVKSVTKLYVMLKKK